MKSDIKYVWGGAAAGAVLGALLGWLIGRQLGAGQGHEVERDRLAKLLWSVVGVVREVIELG